MPITAALADWFNARWVQNMGAIDGEDLVFLAQQIDVLRPRTVVEIGVASGFSTACIANLLATANSAPARLDSFDLATRFYVDPSRPVGYLLAEALPHPGVDVTVHGNSTCLDVAARVSGPIDLCFIDAAHRHPWPLIDTLGILPLMRPGGLIVHHDLKMYLDPYRDNWANGPKVVLDHVPHEARVYPSDADSAQTRAWLKRRGISGNIFALRVPQDRAALEWSLSQGFYIGWDPQFPIPVANGFANRYQRFLDDSFDEWVARAFAEGRRRYSRSTPDWALPGLNFAAGLRRPFGRLLRRAGLRH